MGGRPKALLPHPGDSSRSMVRVAAGTLAEAGLDPVVVVLGHLSREIAPELGGISGVRTVVNPAWREGMLGSLRLGAREAARLSPARWFVVAPVDQPFLSVDLIRRVLAALTPETVAAAPATPEREQRGAWGHPVALSRELLPELMELRANPGSDRGAAALLRRHRKRMALVEAEARELMDVDHWDEYLRLRTGG